MFDEEERPKPSRRLAPLPLAALGVEELRDYIASLRAEIARAEVAIAARDRQRGAADALFRQAPPESGQ